MISQHLPKMNVLVYFFVFVGPTISIGDDVAESKIREAISKGLLGELENIDADEAKQRYVELGRKLQDQAKKARIAGDSDAATALEAERKTVLKKIAAARRGKFDPEDFRRRPVMTVDSPVGSAGRLNLFGHRFVEYRGQRHTLVSVNRHPVYIYQVIDDDSVIVRAEKLYLLDGWKTGDLADGDIIPQLQSELSRWNRKAFRLPVYQYRTSAGKTNTIGHWATTESLGIADDDPIWQKEP